MNDRVRRSNMFLVGVPEERKRKNGKETIFKEIMAENFSKLMKDIMPQIQEGNKFQTEIRNSHLDVSE